MTWSQTAQSSDGASTRHLGQYLMHVGQEQYNRGSYDQAVKTFRMAQEHKDSLDPIEQRKLQSLQEKAVSAAAEQKRVAEASPSQTGPVSASPPTSSGAGDTTGAPGQSLSALAYRYYQSVVAYTAGDLETAQAGFTRVLEDESLPTLMAETIRGYLAEIEAKQSGGTSVVPARASTETAPAVGVTALANTPAVSGAPVATDTNAPAAVAAPLPASEVERIAELYYRSLELYGEGELLAARQGFVEVARSGLFQAPEGRRPEDYVIAIDRRLAATQQAQAPVPPGPAVTPPIPVTPPPVRPAEVAPLAEGQTAPEQGGSIEAINRRRNIIRSHTEAVVNDALAQAQTSVAQGQFDAAMDRLAEAQRVVEEAQFYLGEELYRQHTQRLNQMTEKVQEARAERDRQLVEKRRQDAAVAQNELRVQA
ncbi:MAG: hypothetical protein FJ280_30360, partial [Planctomycetes bacterium]|nr:hypothetical protein [Planctomycetota bacterium]